MASLLMSICVQMLISQAEFPAQTPPSGNPSGASTTEWVLLGLEETLKLVPEFRQGPAIDHIFRYLTTSQFSPEELALLLRLCKNPNVRTKIIQDRSGLLPQLIPGFSFHDDVQFDRLAMLASRHLDSPERLELLLTFLAEKLRQSRSQIRFLGRERITSYRGLRREQVSAPRVGLGNGGHGLIAGLLAKPPRNKSEVAQYRFTVKAVENFGAAVPSTFFMVLDSLTRLGHAEISETLKSEVLSTLRHLYKEQGIQAQLSDADRILIAEKLFDSFSALGISRALRLLEEFSDPIILLPNLQNVLMEILQHPEDINISFATHVRVIHTLAFADLREVEPDFTKKLRKALKAFQRFHAQSSMGLRRLFSLEMNRNSGWERIHKMSSALPSIFSCPRALLRLNGLYTRIRGFRRFPSFETDSLSGS